MFEIARIKQKLYIIFNICKSQGYNESGLNVMYRLSGSRGSLIGDINEIRLWFIRCHLYEKYSGVFLRDAYGNMDLINISNTTKKQIDIVT